jgi:phytoene desaturase
MKQVIIVGAGPGGLASAMLLAAAGLEVTVLERHDRVGGRCSTLEADGFRFDLGPTFFLYPDALRQVFQWCGRRLDDEVELLRLPVHYRLAFEDDGTLDVFDDLDELERALGAFAPADAAALRPYMEDNRRKLAAFKPILESPFTSLADLLTPSMAKLLPLVRPWASVDADLRRHFADPRVRLAFSFQSKYLGMSPFKCPSLFTILAFLEREYGVWHPRGGCGALSVEMARVAEELGASIRLGEPVEEILVEGRRAVGVRTRSGVERCDALVVNADFAQAMTRLVPNAVRRRWSDERIARKKFSCSTFMMYLGLDGRQDELRHHTILLPRDYRENLRDIEDRHVLSENPAVYVQNPGVTDDTLAPEGQSTLYVLVPVTHLHPNVDWAAERDRFRELTLRQLAKLGLSDLESRIRHETILTPADWRDEHAIYRGATFNLTHSLDQMLHLRPRNRFEDLDGVYLAGGGTHPGSGLPVIYEAARISSRLLAQDLGLGDPWEALRAGAAPSASAALAGSGGGA